eukprot:6210037-Pleurochrysis_carterae.AAC.1
MFSRFRPGSRAAFRELPKTVSGDFLCTTEACVICFARELLVPSSKLPRPSATQYHDSRNGNDAYRVRRLVHTSRLVQHGNCAYARADLGLCLNLAARRVCGIGGRGVGGAWALLPNRVHAAAKRHERHHEAAPAAGSAAAAAPQPTPQPPPMYALLLSSLLSTSKAFGLNDLGKVTTSTDIVPSTATECTYSSAVRHSTVKAAP